MKWKSLSIKANFFSLLGAQLWHRASLAITAILLAHAFGSEALGRLLSTISFVMFFWVVIDAGLCELFVRDVASRRDLLAPYARQLLSLKGVLAVASLGLMALITWASPPLRSDWQLVMLLGLCLTVESYAIFFRVFFRIQERMHLEAVLWVVDGALRLVVVGWLLWFSTLADPLIALAAGWLIMSVVSCALAAWSVRRWWPARLAAVRLEAWLPLLRRGVPLALVFSLGLINLRGMILLVDLLLGHAEAGYFGAGERILEALLIVPMTLAFVMLPVSARMGSGAVSELRRVAWRVVVSLLVGGAVVTLGLVWWGGPLVRLLFGSDFQPAGALMGLLGLVMAPLFMKPVVEKMLCGLHRQQFVWQWYLAGAVCNAVAVWTVTPLQGLTGATVCLLVTEVVTVGVLLAGLWHALAQPRPAGHQASWPLEKLLEPAEAQEVGV